MARAGVAAPRKKRDSFADLLGRPNESAPLSESLERRSTGTAPRVWEFPRADLEILRLALEQHGWPVNSPDPAEAMLAAQQAGALDLSPCVERFGAAGVRDRGFVVLPVLDDPAYHRPKNTFRVVWTEGRGAVVVPPEGDVAAERADPVRPACLYVPFRGPQEDFHAACEFELLFGGAKGGAKTGSVVGDAARYCEHSTYKAFVFRKTGQALLEIIRRAKLIYGTDGTKGLGATYHELNRIFTFPSGAVVELGFLETPEDAERVQGREPTRVYVDEAAQVAHHKSFAIIRAEIRGDARLMWGMRYTANPIGPGVPFLKKRFIDTCGATGERVYQERVMVKRLGEVVLERRFIPSKVTDNPVYANNPIYLGNLYTLPDGLRKLLLDGDWSAAQGAYYGELDRAKHLRPGLEIPSHARLLAGFDWGFAHRWALVLAFRDEDQRLVVVDTLWGRQQQVDEVADRWKSWERLGGDEDAVVLPNRKIRVPHSSPGLFSRRAEAKLGSLTRADDFARAGYPLREGDEGPGSRRRKGETLRGLLAWKGREADEAIGMPGSKDREPMMVFADTPGNRILVGQLEMMVPDPDNPEEPLKVDFDEDAAEMDHAFGQVLNVSGDDGQDALWFLADADRTGPAKAPEARKVKEQHYDDHFERVIESSTRPVHLIRGQ